MNTASPTIIKCCGPNCSAEYHREKNNWFMVAQQGKFTVSRWNPEFESWPDCVVAKVCGLRCAVALMDKWMVAQLKK